MKNFKTPQPKWSQLQITRINVQRICINLLAENLRTFPTKKSWEEKLYSQTTTAKTVLTVFRNKLLKPKFINLSILKQLYPEKKYQIT